jgi:hypothetical protein
MTHRPTALAVACVAFAAGAIAGTPAAQAHAKPGKLTVKPGDVMVNTTVTVKGKGFAHSSAITLHECGSTTWLVPEEPCSSANVVTVETNARGGFTTSMRADVCPEGMPGKAITERTCYVGVEKVTEDTGALVPWAKLIVTYP